MGRFEIIGYALFWGVAFAAFLAPIVLLVWLLDRKSSKPREARDD